MVNVYADKIWYKKLNAKTGRAWTIADVPQKYRTQVQAELDSREASEV